MYCFLKFGAGVSLSITQVAVDQKGGGNQGDGQSGNDVGFIQGLEPMSKLLHKLIGQDG